MNETTEPQPLPPPEPVLISLRNLLEWSAQWLNEHGDPEGEVQWHHLIIPMTRQTAEEFESASGDAIYRTFTSDNMPVASNAMWENWSNYLLDLRRDERGGPPERIDHVEITRYVRRTWMQIKEWLANQLYDEDEEFNPTINDLEHPFELSDNTKEILGSIFSTYHIERIPRQAELYEENPITRRITREAALIRWKEIVAEMFFDEEGIGVYITEDGPVQAPAPVPLTPPVDVYCSFGEASVQLAAVLSHYGVHIHPGQLTLPISSENRMHILNAVGVYPPAVPSATNITSESMSDITNMVTQWRAGVVRILLEHKRWTIHWTDGNPPETAPEGYVHPWLRPTPSISEQIFTRAADVLGQLGQSMERIPVPIRPAAELAGLMEIEGLDVGTRMNFTITGTDYRPNREGIQITIQQMVTLVLGIVQGPTVFTWEGSFINEIIEKLTQRAIRINEVQQHFENFHDPALYEQRADHGSHPPTWERNTLDFYEDNNDDMMADWVRRWLDSQTISTVIMAYWEALPTTDPDPIF